MGMLNSDGCVMRKRHRKRTGAYYDWWRVVWLSSTRVGFMLNQSVSVPKELVGRRVRLRLEVLPESCPGSSEERLLEEEEE